jgi:hypothetical protein
MPSFLKTTYYFTKHIKFFKKFSPFCFCFCYSPLFKKYNLLLDRYLNLYTQPYRQRRRRRRYFKYDIDHWTDGFEGYQFKPRISNFTHTRIRFSNFKNINFYKSNNIFTTQFNFIQYTDNTILNIYDNNFLTSDYDF